MIAAGLRDTLDTQKNMAKWLKELGSDEFPVREAATKALLAQGIRALPAVQAWCAAARAEHHFVAEDDPYRSPPG